MIRLTVLASGSSGNCAFVESEGARILIDAGLSGKQIEQRLNGIGHSLDDVQAVFVTHEHEDHVRGLPVLTRRRGIPVYANRPTAAFLEPQLEGYQGWQIFETGNPITFGDLTIESFPVPHDAYEPVGFLVRGPSACVGFVTDLGYATRLVIERARAARALVLEANHDVGMLHADTRRPWAVKQRILSRHGHLSNEAAAEVASQLVQSDLEHLFLGHLSPHCNTPETARAVVGGRLAATSSRRIALHDTSPTVACPTLELV